MKNFVINLDSSTARLEAVSLALDEAGIPFTRLPAVDGKLLRSDDLKVYDDAAAQRFVGRSLVAGEIACFLSHVECLKEFSKGDGEHTIIFEDDAKVVGPLADFISEMTAGAAANTGWSVVSLCADRLKIFTPMQTVAGHEVVHAHYFPMRATALLWSRHGAEMFLNDFSKIDAPYDIYLRRWTAKRGDALASRPALVTHSDLDSDILSNGGGMRSQNDRARFYTLRRLRRMMNEKIRAQRLKARHRLIPGAGNDIH